MCSDVLLQFLFLKMENEAALIIKSRLEHLPPLWRSVSHLADAVGTDDCASAGHLGVEGLIEPHNLLILPSLIPSNEIQIWPEPGRWGGGVGRHLDIVVRVHFA